MIYAISGLLSWAFLRMLFPDISRMDLAVIMIVTIVFFATTSLLNEELG